MDTKRFVNTYSQGALSANLRQVIVDTETGVNYLIVGNNITAGTGACVLVDQDGKPLVTPIVQKDI